MSSSWRSAIIICLVFVLLKKPSLAFESDSSRIYTGKVTVEVEYLIRDCTLEDFHSISKLATNAFHFHPSSATRHHTQMEEHARLLSHYPAGYPADSPERFNHRMLICVFANRPDEAIGFCQLMNRPPMINPYFTHNPRPLITDLAVCSSMRRKGIASKMVEMCEWISSHHFNSPTVSIRVVDKNTAARAMYESMGYNYIDWPEERHPELMVLQKQLQLSRHRPSGSSNDTH